SRRWHIDYDLWPVENKNTGQGAAGNLSVAGGSVFDRKERIVFDTRCLFTGRLGASALKINAWSTAPVSMFFATVGWIGVLLGGPGTYAAAVAVLPVVWMSHVFSPGVRLLILAVVTVLSVLWSERAGRALQESDSSKIVIDEVVG